MNIHHQENLNHDVELRDRVSNTENVPYLSNMGDGRFNRSIEESVERQLKPESEDKKD